MQKEYYYTSNPKSEIWDNMWTSRTIEQELEACEMESPPMELFLKYISKQDKIIDAGCGFGKWVVYLHRRGYNIRGFDNNKLAITKLKNFDSTLKVEFGDILNTNYPDNYFDAYISMGVIEHFEEGPSKALTEAWRIIKPGGLIFVSVPTINALRKIIRRPIRNFVNSLIGAPMLVKSGWHKHKYKVILSVMVNLLPERVIRFILRKKNRYYHFGEYRYSKIELKNLLTQSRFEVIDTIPHDFYGSKDHAIGLVVDFRFLGAWNAVNFRLNPIGRLVSRMLDYFSPWIACSSVICVGRSLKKDS